MAGLLHRATPRTCNPDTQRNNQEDVSARHQSCRNLKSRMLSHYSLDINKNEIEIRGIYSPLLLNSNGEEEPIGLTEI